MRIDSYPKLIEVLTLQAANLATYQVQVGATTDEMHDVPNELSLLVYWNDYADVIDANKKTVFNIKQAIFNGDAAEPLPTAPVFPAAAPPVGLIIGCLQRTQERNRRWKAAAGYTVEIGTALGLEENSPKIVEANVKLGIEVFAAQTGYTYTVVASNRADATAWDVSELRKGTPGFVKVETFTGKSGDVQATPTVVGSAEQFQVRIQGRKANKNYGQPSDVVFVTINP